MTTQSDYDTVARALRFLRQEQKSQPSLDEVAAHVGLSSFHFQRLFTRWAGVSPKRFLQFLTVQEAKARLRASQPILRAAFETGLSGPARLHDLFVTTTAVTPGEYKTGGSTVPIRHGLGETPFGPALLGLTPRGICHLAFLDQGDPSGEEALTSLKRAWPEADLIQDSQAAAAMAIRIFSATTPPAPGTVGSRQKPLSLLLRGTNFQLRVWEALLRVPEGALTTYGWLARVLGKEGAGRALGTAVGRNPVAYLIPCHRVIREEGSLGGYRWDPIRKEAILAWEGARMAG